ncbi:probable DNA helicase MCM8 [Phalaenopsis equestris]|uniref:probable DNA helicase MCM8 n=1 Tax=Phalaenopsis equestris TaxID=78828 RepID=UPI0009E20D5C|nr:probable DNA helicase MCM8 [Phalaenopsis equestris]
MYAAEEGRALDRNVYADTAADIWPFYFPEADFAIDDRRYKLLAELADFFSSLKADSILSNVQYDSCVFLPVDFQQLQKVCLVEGFYANLREVPKESLLCMGAAAHMALLLKGNDHHIAEAEKINIRLYNHPDSLITLKSLKAAYIGWSYAFFLGFICYLLMFFYNARTLLIKAQCSVERGNASYMAPTLSGHNIELSTASPVAVLALLTRCHRCSSPPYLLPLLFQRSPFAVIISDSNVTSISVAYLLFGTRETAVLLLQEILKSGIYEEGRVPRTVECELTLDLVDSCIPGDDVTVTGIIKVINNYMDIGGVWCSSSGTAILGRGSVCTFSAGMYYLYLEAVSVRNSKSYSVSEEYHPRNSETKSNMLYDLHTFSQRDLEFIVKFSGEYGPDIFRQIVQSFCPSIYGHEFVKAGITLALFGGVQKYSMDENKVPVRGDIHVIIVGDPGLGKSQLLQAAATVSPRGIYVCGNATTNAGLTVAIVKDHMTSDYAFEAGAMVLADGGLCCIDEFDKMSAEYQALLEAMEQQCVSIAKAGLVASLSARASVLAAANPVGGHYNRAKTVNENLKMSAALLSRFDLVFILLDKPDEVLDKRVSDHIMALHTGNGEHLLPAKKLSRGCLFPSTIAKHDSMLGSCGDIAFGVSGSLISRLRLDLEKDKDFVPLPGPLLRKYIAYARTFVFPSCVPERKSFNYSHNGSEIFGYTIQFAPFPLRLVPLDRAPTPARLLPLPPRLLDPVSDVVEIMKESLYDKFVDEHGFVDFARSGGMSQQKEAKRFLSALNKQSELQQKDCFSISEIYSLSDMIGLRVPDLDTLVDNLNSAGYLLKKGPKMYQVLSSSYS